MINHQIENRGRFAPSPTGRMHLGNVFSALLSFLSAHSKGGKWVLRIEDLDPERSRKEYSEMLEDDLNWLGLDWDEGGSKALRTLLFSFIHCNFHTTHIKNHVNLPTSLLFLVVVCFLECIKLYNKQKKTKEGFKCLK